MQIVVVAARRTGLGISSSATTWLPLFRDDLESSLAMGSGGKNFLEKKILKNECTAGSSALNGDHNKTVRRSTQLGTGNRR